MPIFSASKACTTIVLSFLSPLNSALLRTVRRQIMTPSSITRPALQSFCVDFDETITCVDTTSAVLFESVVDAVQDQTRRDVWAELSTWYGDEAKTWREGELGRVEAELRGAEKTTADERLAALLSFAKRTSEFEAAAVARVSASRVLQGVTRGQLRARASAAAAAPSATPPTSTGAGDGKRAPPPPSPLIQEGVHEAFQLAGVLLGGEHPAIVSINWSREVVSAALTSARIPYSAIYCNELEFDDDDGDKLSKDGGGKSTGKVNAELVSSMWGKVAVQRAVVAAKGVGVVAAGAASMKTTIETLASADGGTPLLPCSNSPLIGLPSSSSGSSGSGGGGGACGAVRGVRVFVGDSITDLAAMVEADVGVLIGGRESVKQACGVFGVAVLPLDDLRLTNQEAACGEEEAPSSSSSSTHLKESEYADCEPSSSYSSYSSSLRIFEAVNGWSDVTAFLRRLSKSSSDPGSNTGAGVC
mmetsp:Transcript_60483/g.118578  ORF Transcript_60483/g.118578 Transcript_60483/m.118578 type:complete len:474 (-) Transcript_60483:263-1684(-)